MGHKCKQTTVLSGPAKQESDKSEEEAVKEEEEKLSSEEEIELEEVEKNGEEQGNVSQDEYYIRAAL